MGGPPETILSQLGLTADEVRGYVTLLDRGRLTARDLAAAAGISRGRIYDVVGGLLDKGAALEAVSKVRSFQAVAPEVVVANLLEKQRRSLLELEELGKDLVETLAARHVSGSIPPSFVESLRHRSTIGERFTQLQEEAAEELLIFSVPPYHTTDGVAGNDAEIQSLMRGVSVRCVYESSALEDQGELAAIETYARAGEDARHINKLPTKLVVCDRSITMLQLSEPLDPGNVVTLVFRHEGFSELAAIAFERIWDGAAPLTVADFRAGSLV